MSTTTALQPRPSTLPVPAASAGPAYNSMAGIALALAFVTIIGGIVCGHVALSQIHRTGERGAWLAVVALVIGYGWIALGAAFFLGTAVLALQPVWLR